MYFKPPRQCPFVCILWIMYVMFKGDEWMFLFWHSKVPAFLAQRHLVYFPHTLSFCLFHRHLLFREGDGFKLLPFSSIRYYWTAIICTNRCSIFLPWTQGHGGYKRGGKTQRWRREVTLYCLCGLMGGKVGLLILLSHSVVWSIEFDGDKVLCKY